MDFKELKSFIKLAKDEGLTELKYETKDLKISLTFPYGEPVKMMTAPRSLPIEPQSDLPMANKTQAATVRDLKVHEIKSPFVGTFYSSPAPGEPTFVKVGEHINKGKVLCILEAMKIMNEIESDISGTVVEICLDNESLVEYNQVMFKIRAD